LVCNRVYRHSPIFDAIFVFMSKRLGIVSISDSGCTVELRNIEHRIQSELTEPAYESTRLRAIRRHQSRYQSPI
jgi:hypothetical protein